MSKKDKNKLNVLDNMGFDNWASDYDKDVKNCEDNNLYPFASYSKILNYISKIVEDASNQKKEKLKILDIGLGTGKLTNHLYKGGHNITGLDFSDEMLNKASIKMPEATFIKYDMNDKLPEETLNKKFDFIILTYSIHHLNDEKMNKLIYSLVNILENNGEILIGDVMTQTLKEMDLVRKKDKDFFDEEENYIIISKFQEKFPQFKLDFLKFSYCSGVLRISKKYDYIKQINHDDLSLRQMTHDDAKELLRWWNDGEVMAHAGFPNGLNTNKEEVLNSIDYCNNVGQGFIIYHKEKKIGELNFKTESEDIASIGIKICEKNYLEKGHGRIILSILINLLFNDYGFKKIVLDTSSENKRAHHVYELLGFKKYKTIKDAYISEYNKSVVIYQYLLIKDNFNDFTK